MVLTNFIQVIIRGLINGQHWQVSPTYTAVEDQDNNLISPLNTFRQSSIVGWFDALWNGNATIGTANGLGDELREALAVNATINEVRILARTQSMQLPVQLIYAANITGGRALTSGREQSFIAASLYAVSDDYGQRGASMRLPILIEEDTDGDLITPGRLGVLRDSGGLLAALTNNASLAPLSVWDQFGAEQQGVLAVAAVVNRVYPNSGPVTSSTRKEFPYLPTHDIQAHTCLQWQVHDYVGTQNSRKLGRGN